MYSANCKPDLVTIDELRPLSTAFRACTGSWRKQHQRDQRRETEKRRDDHDAASHRFDQQSETERRQRLADARRRADEAEPIGVVFRSEDRQRQRSARDRQDAVAGAVQQGEAAAAPPPKIPMTQAPIGCVMQASRVENSG